MQQVGSLRAGRFFAVRLRAYAYAELDTGPAFFDDTYTSELLPFRTLPCIPGQMQAPSLARRDRNLLKVSLAAGGSAPGATAGAAGGCPYHRTVITQEDSHGMCRQTGDNLSASQLQHVVILGTWRPAQPCFEGALH